MASGDEQEKVKTPEFDRQAKISKNLGILGIATTIIGIGVILGLIALVLGLKSRSRIKESNGQVTGQESATIGIISGAISGILFPVIVVIFFIIQPNVFEKSIRSKISQVKIGENSLETALQSYRIDYRAYPFPGLDEEKKTVIPSILTTPVSYMSGLIFDPFKNNGTGMYEYDKKVLEPKKLTDKYFTEEWIVTSYGPDKVDGNSDVPGGTFLVEKTALLDSTLGFPLATSPLTYDPTNGLVSPGDIWKRRK